MHVLEGVILIRAQRVKDHLAQIIGILLQATSRRRGLSVMIDIPAMIDAPQPRRAVRQIHLSERIDVSN